MPDIGVIRRLQGLYLHRRERSSVRVVQSNRDVHRAPVSLYPKELVGPTRAVLDNPH
jgi:hypothetical protein